MEVYGREEGSGVGKERERGAWRRLFAGTLQNYSTGGTRLVLSSPVSVRAGARVGLYLQSEDGKFVGLTAQGKQGAKDVSDGTLAVLYGRCAGSTEPFGAFGGSDDCYAPAGAIEYELAIAEADPPAPEPAPEPAPQRSPHERVCALGFAPSDATAALAACGGDALRAVERLVRSQAEAEQAAAVKQAEAAAKEAASATISRLQDEAAQFQARQKDAEQAKQMAQTELGKIREELVGAQAELARQSHKFDHAAEGRELAQVRKQLREANEKIQESEDQVQRERAKLAAVEQGVTVKLADQRAKYEQQLNDQSAKYTQQLNASLPACIDSATVEQLKMQAATTQARAEAEVMLAKAEAAEAKAEAAAAKLASPTSSGPTIDEWLAGLRLEVYTAAVKETGYTVLLFLKDAEEEHLDEMAKDIGMKRPHLWTLKRAWKQLVAEADNGASVASSTASEPESPLPAEPAAGPEPESEESHGAYIGPQAPAHEFDLVFSNKTAFDSLCLEVRAKLVPEGVRVWQQRTNIPKDSDNCTLSALAPENARLHFPAII